MKKTTLSTPELQRTIISVLFALLITSCASYKAIAPETIAPGNVVRVRLKTGETIKELKVAAVDSLSIAGGQSIFNLETSYYQSRIIRRTDIQSIKKRKISAGKTAALVVILITSPAWLWAIAGAPL